MVIMKTNQTSFLLEIDKSNDLSPFGINGLIKEESLFIIIVNLTKTWKCVFHS